MKSTFYVNRLENKGERIDQHLDKKGERIRNLTLEQRNNIMHRRMERMHKEQG